LKTKGGNSAGASASDFGVFWLLTSIVFNLDHFEWFERPASIVSTFLFPVPIPTGTLHQQNPISGHSK
jgi:hypothetical protein